MRMLAVCTSSNMPTGILLQVVSEGALLRKLIKHLTYIRLGSLSHSVTSTRPTGHSHSRDFASQLFKTVYSKRHLVGARPNVFVSVFAPHDRASEAAAMAAGTTIKATVDHVKVIVALANQQSVEVSLGQGDTWTLTGN